MQSVYQSFIQQLDAFIRKYYKNLLIKGVLLDLLCIGAVFLLFSLMEYFSYFNQNARLILLLLFGLIFLLSLIFWILIPLSKYYRLGKTLTYEQAAEIISTYFPEIEDKLLNVLQLNSLSQNENIDKSLLEAGIRQKINNLKVYNFVNAIDFKANRKYLRFALIPVLILLSLILFSPSMVVSPAQRIWQYNRHFEKPMPFELNVLNESLEVVQQEDFVLKVKVSGSQLPAEVKLKIGENLFKMNAEDKTTFTYTFKNVQKAFDFSLVANDFESMPYHLTLLSKPVVFDFRMTLNFPSYLKRTSEIVENNGDVVVPKGTVITWQIRTRDAQKIEFKTDGGANVSTKGDASVFKHSMRAMSNFSYVIIPTNNKVKEVDSMRFQVSVVEDAYPRIEAFEMADSLQPQTAFFRGRISDDYGFTTLHFCAYITNVDKKDWKDSVIQDIPFNDELTQEFLFSKNFAEMLKNFGDRIDYYFEVYDNDEISGYKVARSASFSKGNQTKSELEKTVKEQGKDIAKRMEDVQRENLKLRQETDRLTKKLLEKPNPEYEEKKQLEDLIKRQQALQNEVQNLKKEIQEKSTNEQKLNEQSEALLEKQKELEKLMDQVFDDEMKKMLQELQNLMNQNVEKDKFEKAVQDIKSNTKELEKEMDRNLEIFKQLEYEKKMEEFFGKLDELKKQQENLRNETAKSEEMDKQSENNEKKTDEKLANDIDKSKENQQDKAKSAQDLKNDQKNLEKAFKDLQNTLNEAEKQNKQLEQPNDFKRDENLEKSIQESMKNASDALDKNDKREAQKNQKDAEEKMDELSEKMDQMMQDSEDEKDAEDAESIRRLLKNIVQTSLNQEENLNALKQTRTNNPLYQNVIREQSRLKDDFQQIEDSLNALEKRQPKIANMISGEVKTIRENVSGALSDLLKMNDITYQRYNAVNNNALVNQQKAMTSLNNLALLLAESLDKMEQNQKQKKQGKSGKGKPKPGQQQGGKAKDQIKSARQMQQELQQRLEQMKKQMGEQKGGEQPKRQPGGQQGASMSEQFARAAAQQEAIRRMLQQAAEEMKKENARGAGKLNDLINEMDNLERDLVNKVLNDNTMKRQAIINTRLLEAEKAEMEREQEERRKSNEAQQQLYKIPDVLLEYNRQKNAENEILKKYQPSLTPFYKQKVNDYFYKIGD